MEVGRVVDGKYYLNFDFLEAPEILLAVVEDGGAAPLPSMHHTLNLHSITS